MGIKRGPGKVQAEIVRLEKQLNDLFLWMSARGLLEQYNSDLKTSRDLVNAISSEAPGVSVSLDSFIETEAEAVHVPRGVPASFDAFWAIYPNRKNKGAALRAWKKLNPDGALQSRMFATIRNQSQSQDWQKESGKFIPHPASWLNGMRWEDDAKSVDVDGDRMRAETAAHLSMMAEQESV